MFLLSGTTSWKKTIIRTSNVLRGISCSCWSSVLESWWESSGTLEISRHMSLPMRCFRLLSFAARRLFRSPNKVRSNSFMFFDFRATKLVWWTNLLTLCIEPYSSQSECPVESVVRFLILFSSVCPAQITRRFQVARKSFLWVNQPLWLRWKPGGWERHQPLLSTCHLCYSVMLQTRIFWWAIFTVFIPLNPGSYCHVNEVDTWLWMSCSIL